MLPAADFPQNEEQHRHRQQRGRSGIREFTRPALVNSHQTGNSCQHQNEQQPKRNEPKYRRQRIFAKTGDVFGGFGVKFLKALEELDFVRGQVGFRPGAVRGQLAAEFSIAAKGRLRGSSQLSKFSLEVYQ